MKTATTPRASSRSAKCSGVCVAVLRIDDSQAFVAVDATFKRLEWTRPSESAPKDINGDVKYKQNVG